MRFRPRLCYNNSPARFGGWWRKVITYQKLWVLLRERNMTKKDLALRAGISDSTVRVMTRGGNVSLEVLGKICTALRVDLGDIASFVDV